jgi:hypothetical protein
LRKHGIFWKTTLGALLTVVLVRPSFAQSAEQQAKLLDFGYRGAKVDAARAVQNRVAAEASLTRLDVTVATVNAYLTLLAAEQTVRAAQADVERRETFTKSVHVLVGNHINVNRERAGQLGVTTAGVGRSFLAATSSSRFVAPNYWAAPRSGFAYLVQVPQSDVTEVRDVEHIPATQGASSKSLDGRRGPSGKRSGPRWNNGF